MNLKRKESGKKSLNIQSSSQSNMGGRHIFPGVSCVQVYWPLKKTDNRLYHNNYNVFLLVLLVVRGRVLPFLFFFCAPCFSPLP